VAPHLKDAALAPGEATGGRAGQFLLRFGNEFFYRQMRSPRRQQILEAVVRDVTGEPWKARMELGAPPPDSPPPDSPPPDSPPPAPDADEERGSGEEPVPPAPAEPLSRHPLVKKSIELFNGKLV
jgi:hypothetical protein